MASSSEIILLKSTFDVNGKPFSVKLTASEINWEVISPGRAASGPYSEPLVKTESQTAELKEIIAVTTDQQVTCKKEGQFQNLELASNATSFTVHVVKRVFKYKWKVRKVLFHSRDMSVCQQWIEKLQDMLNQSEKKRPKKLLVFVNPIGGKKQGRQIYRYKVAPIFELARISTDVIITQRINHARDTLLQYDFSTLDGVVCVGGDGMFTELMHGLLTRKMRDADIDHYTPTQRPQSPDLRIGVIPAGSTDAVAYSVHGFNDPVTAALHIVIGDDIGLDVLTVYHGDQFLRYNVSLLGYGYYADVLIGCEHKRWMGPKRYQWAGLLKFIGNKSYEGEISFLPCPDKESFPKNGIVCRTGCQVCSSPDPDIPASAAENQIEQEPPNTQWQTIKGRFLAVNSFAMSCHCGLSPEGVSQFGHLGDGCLDLCLVRDCSRIQYCRHLYRCMHQKADQFDLDCIQVFRVKEFKFRPLVEEFDETQDDLVNTEGQQKLRSRSTHNSMWNCDGEPLDEPSIDVRVHRQLIRLFGRGIEEDMGEEAGSCFSCFK